MKEQEIIDCVRQIEMLDAKFYSGIPEIGNAAEIRDDIYSELFEPTKPTSAEVRRHFRKIAVPSKLTKPIPKPANLILKEFGVDGLEAKKFSSVPQKTCCVTGTDLVSDCDLQCYRCAIGIKILMVGRINAANEQTASEYRYMAEDPNCGG